MSSFLFTLLFSLSFAHSKEFPLKVFYIEDLIEKEVNWPAYIEPIGDLNPDGSPSLKVFIGIPELIKIKPDTNKVLILNSSKHNSPFKPTQEINDFLSLETKERTTLIKLLKERSDGRHVPVVLKLVFDNNHSFVGVSNACKRLFDIKSLRFERLHPFLIHMDCKDEKNIFVSASEGFLLSKTANDQRLNKVSAEVKNISLSSPTHLTFATHTEDQSGLLKIDLLSKADILDAFEYPRRLNAKRTPDYIGPRRSKVRTIGTQVSSLDPEVFASLAVRKENAPVYFLFSARSTLPSLFQGSSIEHPMDYQVSGIGRRILHLKNLPQRILFGAGIEATRISTFESQRSYIGVGPKIQFGIHRLYEWSDRLYVGMIASHSRISHQPFRMSHIDQIHEVEMRFGLVQADGRLLEPMIIYQKFDLKHFNKREVSTLKLGLGVRF